MKKPCLLLEVCACLVLSWTNVSAALLYGASGGHLHTIDTDTLSTTFIGSIPSGPEIQLDPSGSIIYSGTLQGDPLSGSDPLTTAPISSVVLTSWPNTSYGASDTLTAMEYVGGTLYATATVAGAEFQDSRLVTIDNVSGLITDIGSSNTAHPLTGLAYDAAGSIMYGITGTSNNNSQLVTVDLVSGSTSVIGQVTLGGIQQDSMTSLVFGSDGVLYTSSNSGDNLYSINSSTAELTNLGNLGIQWTALTAAAVPLPPAIWLFGSGLLGLIGLSRRQRTA